MDPGIQLVELTTYFMGGELDLFEEAFHQQSPQQTHNFSTLPIGVDWSCFRFLDVDLAS